MMGRSMMRRRALPTTTGRLAAGSSSGNGPGRDGVPGGSPCSAMTGSGAARRVVPVPAAALATARRREAGAAAVAARTGAETWARDCIGQACGLSVVHVQMADLSPMDRQDFTMRWATGWQAVPERELTAEDRTRAAAMAEAMVRPCLDVAHGRATVIRAMGETSLLLRVPKWVMADPEPVLVTYAGAMAGWPLVACEDAIRTWPDGHSFWPCWPDLQVAIRERAVVLNGIAGAVRHWLKMAGG